MALTKNPIDGCDVYFEDDGGEGPPVIIMGGFGRSTVATRNWGLAEALADGHRRIFVDHRGHGRSGKPGNPDDYAIHLRVADVVSVLEEVGLESAHYAGTSWGGRLGFALGELAADRFRSLTLCSQMPYAMDAERGSIVTLTTRIIRSDEGRARFLEILRREDRVEGGGEEMIEALALAWQKALDERDLAFNPSAWTVPTLIYVGSEDGDFVDGATRAASQISGATLVVLQGKDHFGAHEEVEGIAPQVRRHIAEAEASRS